MSYTPEHGDQFILQDRGQAGFNSKGTNYSLTPNQWYTSDSSGNTINKGIFVSVATLDYATATTNAGDVGKVFPVDPANLTATVGVTLTAKLTANDKVEVQSYGTYTFPFSLFTTADIGLVAYIAPIGSTYQLTTNRSLALANNDFLIEAGIVLSTNSIFLDFQGDLRGSYNVSQYNLVLGEDVTTSGHPLVISEGSDGLAYLSDRRKSHASSIPTVGIYNSNGFTFSAVTYPTSTSATFTVTSVAGATTGTLLWGGSASGTITLAGGDIGTTSAVAAKIAATGAGGGWTVTAVGNVVNMYASSNLAKPTIALGSATNITFGPVFYYHGTQTQFNVTATGTPGNLVIAGVTVAISAPNIAGGVNGVAAAIAASSAWSGSHWIAANPSNNTVLLTQVFFGQQRSSSTGFAVGSNLSTNLTGTLPAGTNIVVQKLGLLTDSTFNFAGNYGQTVWADVNGAITVNPTTLSYYNDNITPVGITKGTNTIYIFVGQTATYNDPTPIGTIIATPPSGPDYGWLNCNGATLNAVSSPQYQNLYDIIGNTFGGTDNTNFVLPTLAGGPNGFQIKYSYWYIQTVPNTPTFRIDTGWNSWGSVPLGSTGSLNASAGSSPTANMYLDIPTATFGYDPPVTDIFAEVYIQNAGQTIIRKIEPNPTIFTNVGTPTHYWKYGFQLQKNSPNYIRLEFAANGLGYYDYTTITTSDNSILPIDGTWTYRVFLYKIERFNRYYDYTADLKLAQLWSLGLVDLTVPSTTPGLGYLDRSATDPTNYANRLNYNGLFYATYLKNKKQLVDTTGDSVVVGSTGNATNINDPSNVNSTLGIYTTDSGGPQRIDKYVDAAGNLGLVNKIFSLKGALDSIAGLAATASGGSAVNLASFDPLNPGATPGTAYILQGDIVCRYPSSTYVSRASKNNLNRVEVLGFANAAATIGSTLPTTNIVKSGGLVSNGSWNLSVGLPVFLGNEGVFIQDDSQIQQYEYRVYVGIAVSSTQILVNIGEAVLNTINPITQSLEGVGFIEAFSGPKTYIPAAYLDCDGSAISRTQYASLFAVIGTTYGIGDGSTTFNIPDFRGKFLRAIDESSRNIWDYRRYLPQSKAPVTSITTTTITANNTFAVNDIVFLIPDAYNSSPPTNATFNTPYYVQAANATTFSISLTRGGSAISLTWTIGTNGTMNAFKGDFTAQTIGSVSGNNITISNHGYAQDDVITFQGTPGSTLPTGVTVGPYYYVQVINSNSFSLKDAALYQVVTLSSTNAGGFSYRLNNSLGSVQIDAFEGHYHNPLTGTGFLDTIVATGTDPRNSGVSAIQANTTGSPVTDGVNGTPRTGTETHPLNANIYYIVRYVPFQIINITQSGGSSSSTLGLGINFANGQFETDLSGWATYADAAQSTPVDGTGGSPTVTISRNTSTPLFQTGDLVFSKGASNLQGQGFSYDFTIDKGINSQAIQLTYSYITSANYVANDMGMYLFDKTNSVLIPLSTVNINATSGLISTLTTSFYPNITSTSYRLIFHVQTVNATAYTFEVDNISLLVQILPTGPVISEWVSYTPTLGATTTPPTLGTNTLKSQWRRTGSSIDLDFTLKQTGAGSAGSGTYLIPLPTGFTINTTNLILGTQNTKDGSVVGYGSVGTSGAEGVCAVKIYSTTQLYLEILYTGGTAAYWGSSAFSTSQTTLNISFNVTGLIISQWSSNVSYAGINEPIYISNTLQTVGSDDTGANTYIGIDGSLIPSLTALHFRDLTLPRLLLINEVPELQVRGKVNLTWIEAKQAVGAGFFGLGPNPDISSGNRYGFGVSDQGAGKLRVIFGDFASNYSGANVTWATVTGAADGFDRWRVVIRNPNSSIEIPLNQFFIGTPVTTNVTTTSVTYASFSTPITVTFIPNKSTKYRVYSQVSVANSSSGQSNFLKIVGTAGTPTVNQNNPAYWIEPTGGGFVEHTMVESIVTLVSGVSYTFELQGRVTSGTLTVYGSTLNTEGNGVSIMAQPL